MKKYEPKVSELTIRLHHLPAIWEALLKLRAARRKAFPRAVPKIRSTGRHQRAFGGSKSPSPGASRLQEPVTRS